MKFTFGWLKEHLDTKASLEEAVERLTMIGLEVAGVHDRAKEIGGFVVGRVVEAKKHPDADKLSVCKVDDGSHVVEVICGAPNARTGLVGVFAAAGSYIPGTGITLKPTKIRGVMSHGMLLSEKEMNLSDNHSAIIELPEDAPLGTPAAEVMGLADPVIEIEVTPNRGDCLGVRGIARDLAAAGVGKLKPLDSKPVKGAFKSPIGVRLEFQKGTEGACPYFVGRLVKGVKNGESPKWLKDKLTAIGLRPISALVDVTNWMTMDLGRPLHVFDAAAIKSDLHVRLSKPGERLMALNGKEYVLDGEMTVIADDNAAEALGGVIGGEASGCTEKTTDMFLESAYFDPARTAMTGRKLDITSDARYRFERGVDPAFLVDGMEIATRLVLDLCGGKPSELVIAGREPDWRRDVTLRPERVRTYGGLDVPKKRIIDILTALGFTAKESGGALRVSAPSWRGDIVGEACLVEEVVRIEGLENIPAVPLGLGAALPRPALGPGQRRRATARRLLAGRGLVEAVTYSFLDEKVARLFGGVPNSLRLVNPISADLGVMRPSLLPNLIQAAGRNAARGLGDVQLFEIGPVFSGTKPDEQKIAVAGIRAGAYGERNWAPPPRPVDLFDAKADALAVLGEIDVALDRIEVAPGAPGWYHPGHSGVMRLGPKTVLAHFGEIHPRVLNDMDVKGPVAGFEIVFDDLPQPKKRKSSAKPHLALSPFQAVERDFAFVVDATVTAAQVLNAARGADKALIAEIKLFDVFEGGNLGNGKKSLAISVTLRPTEKTLTDPEIEAVAKKIVAGVGKATGGVLRT
ncbi:MAG: phenylalanine--tRNA ligase subunit beta [Rhodospirillales bacterium]|nr:phenylalanine--tRNA ligase subunit beta [Rhodospirillales bacterium]